jgi:mannose/fructose/N-acetylgalactosamine-specific phosphotransferase system component IIC/mannose/fructose/N-acetylgalactosamine-specific phosphotransferase system component IID
MIITPLHALAIGLLYYTANTSFLAGQAYFTTWRPLVAGALVGLVLGDVAQGALIGALVNMLYLGYMSVGGTLGIGDAALAGILGAAVGIAADSPGIGLLAGVASATLGYQLLVLRMRGADAIARRIDAAAARGDVAGMQRWHIGAAQAWLFLLTVPTAAALAWVESTAVAALLPALPDWLRAGLELGGRLTPLLGLGLALKFVLGRRTGLHAAAFFAAAVAAALGLPFVAVAAAGALVVVVAVLRAPRPPAAGERAARWTRAEFAAFAHWQFFSHSNYSFSKLQGSGLGCALAAGLPDAAPGTLQRHSGFFNTEVNFGTLIPAALLRMEQRGAPPEEIDRTRQTLMGAVAGFGDELTQGAYLPALLALAIGLTMTPAIGAWAVVGYAAAVAVLMGGIAWKSFAAGLRHEKHAATLLFADARLRAAADAAHTVIAAAAGALAVQVSIMSGFTALAAPAAGIAAALLAFGGWLLLQRTAVRPLWPFLALTALGVALAL